MVNMIFLEDISMADCEFRTALELWREMKKKTKTKGEKNEKQ